MASADSGMITNITPGTTYGPWTATFTTSSTTCAVSYYCGWYPYATQTTADGTCDPNSQSFVYVGDLQSNLGTQGPTTDTFYPNNRSSFKLCLGIARGSDYPRINVAEAVYPAATAPPPAPTPTPTPPTTQPSAPVHENLVPMTVAEGRGITVSLLKSKYHSHFSRSTLTRSCYRVSTLKVRCRVAWHKGSYKWSGSVTMWFGQDDADADYETYTYRTSIVRKHIHRPKPKPTRRSSPPASPSCDPNYAGACLNPNASDYDCAGGSGNGPYYTGPVRVVGNDHYDLDRDGDGQACDT